MLHVFFKTIPHYWKLRVPRHPTPSQLTSKLSKHFTEGASIEESEALAPCARYELLELWNIPPPSPLKRKTNKSVSLTLILDRPWPTDLNGHGAWSLFFTCRKFSIITFFVNYTTQQIYFFGKLLEWEYFILKVFFTLNSMVMFVFLYRKSCSGVIHELIWKRTNLQSRITYHWRNRIKWSKTWYLAWFLLNNILNFQEDLFIPQWVIRKLVEHSILIA